ncbi:hypothetical protein [Desulfobacula sp.]|uniref:hypothetical protein n=1 Tax=Desulfobacula sp. TaxID=2593537 RepID=UPI0025BCE1FB|nr:hypothetical protein [Desulfobacula sp.]MBC2704131.1 hypothetical protein [Desulfobacula sp.]
MEITVCNIAKSRLETIDINITQDNTTRFDYSEENTKIHMLTDIEHGLLITEHNFNYPVLIYDVTRKDIGNDTDKAWKLKESYM